MFCHFDKMEILYILCCNENLKLKSRTIDKLFLRNLGIHIPFLSFCSNGMIGESEIYDNVLITVVLNVFLYVSIAFLILKNNLFSLYAKYFNCIYYLKYNSNFSDFAT